MKKMTLLFTIACIVLSLAANARKITIKVSNFQFSPSTVNAKVGDTIFWKWVNGTHTTTSLTIPAGAKSWDAPMDASHKKFKYILRKTGVYNYQCNIHASVMKGTINVTAALAANLNGFTLTEDDHKAVLHWETNSAQDIAYFSIQRSTDGSNFAEIAKADASASNLYSFKDNSVLPNKYVYYQVMMVDANGNTQLSSILMFANRNTATKLITSLSPNPVSSPGHLMLQFNADKDGVMLARLYNQNGVMIKEAELSVNRGVNNGHFHLGSLSPGTYYIIFTLGSVTEKHIIIMK